LCCGLRGKRQGKEVLSKGLSVRSSAQLPGPHSAAIVPRSWVLASLLLRPGRLGGHRGLPADGSHLPRVVQGLTLLVFLGDHLVFCLHRAARGVTLLCERDSGSLISW